MSTTPELVEHHPGRARVHSIVPKEPTDRIEHAIQIVDTIILNLNRHIDLRVWCRLTHLPPKPRDESFLFLLLGQITHKVSPVICGAEAPPRRCEPPLPEASRLALGQFAEA